MKNLAKYLAVFLVAAGLFVGASTIHAQTIPPLQQWIIDAFGNLTQRVSGTPVKINGNLTVTGTCTGCGGGGGGSGTVTQVNTTYPVLGGPITTTGTVSLAFGTTTSNIWAGTQTFTNSPTFSTLTAGTVNSTSAGKIYNTATSSVSSGIGITFTGTAGALIGGTSLTITNSGVTSNVAGTGISVSGATGAVTIGNTGVISNSCPGGFLSCSGTNPSTFTLGTLGVGNGGTGSTTLTGILKGNGTGIVATAIGDTDYQKPISLTTTGTSGAATFTGDVLNIPQYTGGGGGTNYFTNSGANTFLNTGTNFQAPVLMATSTTATSTFAGDVAIGNVTGTYLYMGTSTTRLPLYGRVPGDVLDAEYDWNGQTSINVANANIGSCASATFFADGNNPSLGGYYGTFSFLNDGWTGVGCSIGAGTAQKPEAVVIANPTGEIDNVIASTTNNGSADFNWFTNTNTPVMKLTNGGNLGVGTQAPSAILTVSSKNNSPAGPLFVVQAGNGSATSTAVQTSTTTAGTGGISVASTTAAGGASLTVGGNVFIGASLGAGTNGSLTIAGLAVPAGSFIAADPTGKLIATTTPAGGSGVTSIGPAGQLQTGPAITFATTTTAFNGLTSNLTITGTGNTLTYAPTLSGTLGVAGGGTGVGTFTSSQLVYGNGTSALTSVATSSESCSSPLSCTGFNVVGTGGGAITLGTVGLANGGTATTTGGVTNGIERFNGTNLTNDAGFIYNGTSVGIGTTTPFGDLSINAPAQTNPYFVIGSSTSQVFSISPSTNGLGSLAISTTTALGTNVLTVNGGVYLHGIATGAGNGALCQTTDGQVLFDAGANCITSSLRFKNDIATLTPEASLATILKLQPVTFRYKPGQGDNGAAIWEGFIAEQVAKVDKNLVQYDANGDGNPYSVYYQNITAKLAGAVHALFDRQTADEARITALEAQVAKLANECHP